MISLQEPNDPRGNSSSKFDLPKHRPNQKEHDGHGNGAEQQAKDNLHHRLGFQLVLNHAGTKSAHDIGGEIDNERDEEEWEVEEGDHGIFDQEPEGRET